MIVVGGVALASDPGPSSGGGGPVSAADIADSTVAGRAVLTGTAAEGRAALDVYSVAEVERIVGALIGGGLMLRPAVQTVIEAMSLATSPLAGDGSPMVYVAGVLTAGVALDLTVETGLTVGDSIAWRFTTSDQEYAGVYTVTDVGAAPAGDDPGHAPVFTRRADFSTSEQFALGVGVLTADGALYRVNVPGGFTLDVDAIKLDLTRALIEPPGDGDGAMLVAAYGAWARLAPGTDGQVLTMVSGAPAWVTP